MSIQALRERLQASNRAANQLLAEKGSQTWTAEDQAAFDGHIADGDRAKAQISAHERMIERDREDNFQDVEDFRVDGKTKPKSEAEKAFSTFLRKSLADMSAEERTAVRNTMSTTTGSQGGFSVQSTVSSKFIDYLKAFGFMRGVAQQLTTENGAPLSFPTTDGTSEQGEWVPQNTTATAADPVFGTVALNTFKVGSKVVAVPIELLQDSQIDMEAFIMKRLTQRIGRTENIGYTIGGGTTDPFGIVTAALVGKVGTTGQTTTIIYDDLVDMVDSLDAAYLDVPATNLQFPGAEPGWMFSQTLRRTLRKIKDTTGRPIWTPGYEDGITAATPDRLLGYPVYLNNDMPTPAANAKSLLFGNLNSYIIRDAMEITMFRFDDSAYMKLGQVGFLAWARTGGNLLDPNAVKYYQNSAT
jgi:HK97 family phage major capsid protein